MATPSGDDDASMAARITINPLPGLVGGRPCRAAVLKVSLAISGPGVRTDTLYLRVLLFRFIR